jgi:LPS-assembly protein
LYSGVLDIRAGATYDQDFTSNGDKFGPDTARSYILGSGLFDITPAWQWGFTAEQTSDKLLFEKYSVPDVFTDRGLYAADDQRLISQLYAVHEDSNSYLSVAAIDVQGLRPNDQQSIIPTVAPLIEGRWEPSQAILGGRLRIDGSAVALTTAQSMEVPALPGIDSRRATIEADWTRPFILSNGLRLDPFVDGRFDLYSLANLPVIPANGATPTTTTGATIPQGFGTLGLDVSYPLIKRSGSVTWVLEPLAQIALSPTVRQNPRIPDEDSADFEFDDTNLFEANKSPGFDIYDGGQKLNLGGRATAFLDDGRTASLLVGRSLRAEADPGIPQYTGLETPLSDYIIEAEITPLNNIHLFSRWRLDTNTFAINRLEAGASFATSRFTGYISYLFEAQSPSGQPPALISQPYNFTPQPICLNAPPPNSTLPACSVNSLDFRGEIWATRHWGLALYGIHDFDAGVWRREDVGIVYRDDCIRVELLYRHDETFNGTLGPSTSVVIRLTLATMGNSGYSPDRPPVP